MRISSVLQLTWVFSWALSWLFYKAHLTSNWYLVHDNELFIQQSSKRTRLSCQYETTASTTVFNTLMNVFHSLKHFWSRMGTQKVTCMVYLLNWPVDVLYTPVSDNLHTSASQTSLTEQTKDSDGWDCKDQLQGMFHTFSQAQEVITDLTPQRE